MRRRLLGVSTQKLLLPFIQTYSAEECTKILSDLSQEMKDARVAVARQMAYGGLESAPDMTGAGADGLDAENGGNANGEALPGKSLVRRVHDATVGSVVVGYGRISQLTFVPGLRKLGSAKGKKSRVEVFRAALGTWPLLFTERQEHHHFLRLRLDVNIFEELLVKYGSAEGALPVFGDTTLWEPMWNEKIEGGNDWDWGEYYPADEAQFSETQTDARTPAGELVETVNLRALKAYAEQGVDRRPTSLSAFIMRCESHGKRNGDVVSVRIEYYQKYGLPSRRYALGPSTQWLTREARSAAFYPHGTDLDVRNCH